MLYALQIECIGDDQPARGSAAYINAVLRRRAPRDAPVRGVWEVEGFSPRARRLLRCQKDYTRANGVGSRGVMALYMLAPARLYYVAEPLSWSRVDRYYCCVEDGDLRRFGDEAEARAWWELRHA